MLQHLLHVRSVHIVEQQQTLLTHIVTHVTQFVMIVDIQEVHLTVIQQL